MIAVSQSGCTAHRCDQDHIRLGCSCFTQLFYNIEQTEDDCSPVVFVNIMSLAASQTPNNQVPKASA